MSSKKIIISIVVILLLFSFGIYVSKTSTPKYAPLPPEKLSSDSLLTKPNFFLGEDGEWYKIDTQIVKSNDSEYGYMNTTNNFKTFFPEQIDKSKNIKFQRADAWVDLNIVSLLTIKKIDDKNQEKIIAKKTIGSSNSVQGRTSSNQEVKNKFSYPKIYQDGDKYIDINYTVYSYKLSEEIVLNKFQDFPELTQHLSLHNAFAKVDGPIINFFHEKTGELLWFISSPKMYEQNDNTKISHGLVYDIKCDNSKTPLEYCRDFTITKKFNDEGKKWLADSTRQYPVVLDPDFQIDNADNFTSWVSSDPANFVVSQETTIKHEGTGSVKVIITPKCWKLAGVCSSSCQYNALGGTITAYPNCGPTACSGNCWGLAGICDVSCTSSGVTTGSSYTTCGVGASCI